MALDTAKHYRVRVRAPQTHIRAVRDAHGDHGQKELLRDIEARLETAGFSPVLAVLEDPTDEEVFHAITRWAGEGRDAGIAVERVDEVEAPPDPSPESRALDVGLTDDEIWMIRTALAKDTNPRHLYGISDTLAPFFPVAHALVRAKAYLHEGQAERNMRQLLAANRAAALAAGVATGKPAEPVRAMVEVLEQAGARWPDVREALGKIVLPRGPWSWLPRTGAADLRVLGGQLQIYALENRLPPSVVLDEARRAACDAVQHDAEALASAPPILRAIGEGLAHDVGYGVRLVRPADIRIAIGECGNEGFVSPTALKLAMATFKPAFANIAAPKRVGSVLQRLERAEPAEVPQLLRARNMRERAERALERQRWVDWYRRAGW